MAVVSCNTSEPIYFIKIVEKNVAKENLRDRLGDEIFLGECYLKGFYLQKSRSKSINILVISYACLLNRLTSTGKYLFRKPGSIHELLKQSHFRKLGSLKDHRGHSFPKSDFSRVGEFSRVSGISIFLCWLAYAYENMHMKLQFPQTWLAHSSREINQITGGNDPLRWLNSKNCESEPYINDIILRIL